MASTASPTPNPPTARPSFGRKKPQKHPLYELTKPGIAGFVMITAGASFHVGSGGRPERVPLLHTVGGTGLATGGALALNQYVERDGVRHRFFDGVFGIFGHGNVAGMGEALEAAQDEVRYYQARNEQAMVHTAAAYAKQSKRLRTFACTTSIGPGATNLATGAANATVNRLPVLLLPGDRFATRRVKPVLQQLERPESGDVSANDVLRPVSRYFDRIERPEMLIDALKNTRGNISIAAKVLKTTVRKFSYKAGKYDVNYRNYR
mgnify:CR=1 FL=1